MPNLKTRITLKKLILKNLSNEIRCNATFSLFKVSVKENNLPMKKAISFVIMLFLLSCQEEIFVNGDYTKLITENYLDSDIEFFPSETYWSSNEKEPSLVLNFYTTKSYPCINYSIEISTFREDNELIIRLEGIDIDRICATAIGPASNKIKLPENTEKLILINGEKIDQYSVRVTEEHVVLSALNRTFSELRYSKIFRIPTKSFVYSSKNDDRHLPLYNAFLDSMKINLNIEEFVFEGEGRIPYTKNSEDEVAKYFMYENEADFHRAGEMFKSFINENTETEDYIYIEMINWRNEKYLSWMLYE